MNLESVSVIIPCYNRSDLVGEAIDSAIAQGEGVEVIVVDDGSTDDSPRVIESYGSAILGIRIDNSGLSEARNVGLRASSRDFIRFLDSDDRIPLGSLKAQRAAAESLPRHQIVVGDAVSIDFQGNRIAPVGYGYSAHAAPGPIPRATMLRFIMNAWLPLFPREPLLDAGGFDRDVVLIEDHEAAVRLLREGHEFVRLPVEVCEVREHPGERLSRNIGAAGYRRLERMYDKLWNELAGDNRISLDSADRAGLGKLIWTAARDASRQGYSQEANRLFGLAGEIAGTGAWEAGLPLRLLYRLLAPYRAERLLMKAKAAMGGGA